MKININKLIKSALLLLVVSTLASCIGTGKYVDSPVLRVKDSRATSSQEPSHLDAADQITPDQAVANLFLSQAAPFSILLCDADLATGECVEGAGGLSATGLGGFFLPLVMDLSRIDVNEAVLDDEGIELKAKVVATVSEIPPVCGDVDGRISMSSGGHANLEFANFYCNWMAIGNVVTTIKLSIDSIHLNDQSFTGYYSMTFYGTGNANGSGYYKAAIVAALQEREPVQEEAPVQDQSKR
jgi:hypothetical protein